MKKLLAIAALVVLYPACSSVQVSSDFDREANFASYKTYEFTKEAHDLQVSDINRKRIMEAVATELAAKGFTKSDQPDVWIDLNIRAQEKQTATATSSNPGYGYGYGYGGRYGYGGGFSTTTINVENYVEGTLFVDMIDSQKKVLVWQGRAVKTIDPELSSERREANIKSAVQQIFTKYPPAVKK